MLSESTCINTVEQHSIPRTGTNRFELRVIVALLLLVNLGLIFGNTPAVNLIFIPSAVTAGEWWRVLSWPFVHVSRYHLIIDSIAFLLIYAGLKQRKASVRIGYALAATAGSLLLPLIFSSEVTALGLCGLSGPAHGLMAITALEMRRSLNDRTIGNLLLASLILKTGWEVVTGNAFLHQLHLGNIGQPIVLTHLGGVIAGVFSERLINHRSKNLVP